MKTLIASVALVCVSLFLVGCPEESCPVETTSVVYELPGETPAPLAVSLPDPRIALYLDPAMLSQDRVEMRKAYNRINSHAYLFREVYTAEEADVVVAYGDLPASAAAWAVGSHIFTSQTMMEWARRTGRGEAVFMHELMHMLNYTSETGDAHDGDGSLMSESIELPYMYLSERHLQFLWAVEVDFWGGDV